MTESNRKKYVFWATIALICVAVDALFVFALGGVVKWLAGLASPYTWAGLVAAALVATRVMRFLGRNPLVRQVQPEVQA